MRSKLQWLGANNQLKMIVRFGAVVALAWVALGLVGTLVRLLFPTIYSNSDVQSPHKNAVEFLTHYSTIGLLWGGFVLLGGMVLCLVDKSGIRRHIRVRVKLLARHLGGDRQLRNLLLTIWILSAVGLFGTIFFMAPRPLLVVPMAALFVLMAVIVTLVDVMYTR